MVAPGATGANFNVLLQFALDEEANKRVQSRVSTIDEELRRIEQDARKAGKAMNESMTNIDTKTHSVQTSVTKLGAELAKLGERSKAGAKETNQAIDSNIKKLLQLEETAKRARQQSAMVSGAAARGAAMFGQGLVLGGLVAGGIFAEANRGAREAEDAGRATRATREWTQATKELAAARTRVDTVLLREALPLLEQAAQIAEKTADFIEKHPELVQAALKTGLVVAGLSAVGLAVTKGIKLVADTAYIAAVATELVAAKLHDRAANKELAAASKGLITNRADNLRAALGVGKTGGLAGGMTLGTAGGIAATIASIAAINVGLAKGLDLLEKTLNEKGKGIGTTITGIVDILTTSVPGFGLIKPFRDLEKTAERDIPLWKNLVDKLLGVKPAADQAAEGLDGLVSAANSPQFENILKAYEDYKNDDLALVQEHYTERDNIVKDALAAETQANKQYADNVAKVNASLSKSLASASVDFANANAQAEQQYVQQRAQVIQDGNAEIERIEKDSKERLAKLTQEHTDRVADLTSQRDALGLAKENQDFRQNVSQEKRQAQQEIKDRRQAIAQRLADLQQSYEQERAQRLADYQARVAELQASAAEQLRELALEHQEELRRIQEQKIARIKELDSQFVEERKRRYQYFIQEIKDLDATLLGEANLRAQYQARMLTDLDAFLASYRAKLGSLGGTTTSSTTMNYSGRASGGYASYGMYLLGDDPSGSRGPNEYVMKGSTTSAAERIIGGRITDQVLLGALQGQAGSSRQMNYYDQRRMEVPMSKDNRAAYKQGAMDALRELIA